MFIFINMRKKQENNLAKQLRIKARVVAVFGSQAQLAKGLELGPMTVCQWFRPGRRVPSEHCLAISDLSDGAISPHELRPDLYPVPCDPAA